MDATLARLHCSEVPQILLYTYTIYKLAYLYVDVLTLLGNKKKLAFATNIGNQ